MRGAQRSSRRGVRAAGLVHAMLVGCVMLVAHAMLLVRAMLVVHAMLVVRLMLVAHAMLLVRIMPVARAMPARGAGGRRQASGGWWGQGHRLGAAPPW